VEKPYIFQTISPIMEEYVTKMDETVQDTRNIQTTDLGSLAVEDDNPELDDNLENGASLNSTQSSSKLLVNTELLRQFYKQGVPTPEGVQFFVNRKIAEAIVAHEEKYHRPISDRCREAPKSIKFGPVLIKGPILISCSRKAVRLMYYILLFCAALVEPKAFFVSVWKMTVIFGAYEIVGREFGWKDEQTPDLLLEPLHYLVVGLLGKGEDAAMRLGYTLGPFVGGIMRGIVDGDDGDEAEE
jgi:hypothetical protein